MARAEFRNGPSFGGLVLAGMAGFIAFFALVLVGEFELTPAAAMAGLITAVVAVVAGLPSEEAPGPVRAQASPVAKAAAHPAAAPAVAPVAAAVAAPVSGGSEAVAQAPLRLDGPRGGLADDLKEIEGIGPAMEKLCHELGFYHFDQIAAWTPAEVAWVDQNLKGFKGRVSRDRWVAQAQYIQTRGLEAFRIAAKTNDY